MTYNAGIRAAAALMAQYANGNHDDRNRAAAVLGLLRDETADAAPTGWQLVPKEPTQAMCEAADALPVIHATEDLALLAASWTGKAVMNKKRWHKMLAAAPTIKGE